jgi:2,5-diamino-6-(ribosylamino)-4(3H)-pyrimidinone 5'-phosphate reductase
MSRPKVILNFAMSIDGKVSTKQYQPAGFTSPEDKRRLLEIRALGDALLVGRNTVAIDNMSMGLPVKELRDARARRGQSEYPIRVIVSNSGNISSDLKLFQSQQSPIIVYSTTRMPASVKEKLADHATLHLTEEPLVRIDNILADLYQEHKIRVLVCEGGPTLARSLAEANAIDEIFLTLAPKLFGGSQAPGLLGPPGTFLSSSQRFQLLSMKVVATECYLHYRAERS